LRLGLALWLVVATLVVWGIGPALIGRARHVAQLSLLTAWVIAEGLFHGGDLVVLPVGRLVVTWPVRVGNWVDQPWRWATPLEAVATALVALVAYGVVRGVMVRSRR
nr:hypothetical protein [Acidimicrobiales bacterium]